MKKYKKRPWTTDERRILASHYYHLDIESMAMLLPGERSSLFVIKCLTYVSEDIGLKHNGTYRMGDNLCDNVFLAYTRKG